MKGFTLLLLCLLLMDNMAFSNATDIIDTQQSISDGMTLVSTDGTFTLGFFSPGTSKNRYVGIWYSKVSNLTVVWVANRDTSLNDSSGVLKINDTGIIVLLNHNKSVIWSTHNTTRAAQHLVVKLLNSGNLVVQDKSNSDLEDFLWQSFDYPSDTFLPEMKIGRNLITGKSWYLTSWNSPDDPSPGRYSYEIDVDGYPQLVMKDGTVERDRFGSWNGNRFSGTPQLKPNSIFRYHFVYNEEKEVYYTYELINKSVLHRSQLTSDGINHRSTWDEGEKDWIMFSSLPVDDCDYYATCGAYASCNTNNFPLCGCLDGFVLNTTYSSRDCFRRTPLSCNGDGFKKVSGLKLPDTRTSWFNKSISIEDCRILCLNNCSCIAYAALDVSNGENGCLHWFGNLIDMKALTLSIEDIYIRMAWTELALEERKSYRSHIRKQRTIILSCVLSLVLILSLAFIIYRWKLWQKGKKMKDNIERETSTINDNNEEDLELPLFDMSTITFATNNFSSDNILGEGGFGLVYKGILEDGVEIAVKRLSQNSSQGLQEFKNEVMHIAKLQHRNLVKILGCCIQAGERLLIYEFMPNKSLDFFIFGLIPKKAYALLNSLCITNFTRNCILIR